ncbi:MAG TPA: phosphohistidine phosphatase SixA [Bacteroidota bacterium]
MLLYFLRHGDALTSPSLHDSERPLSETGVRQSQAAAKFFKSSGAPIDLIIASPLLRAQQMAEPTRTLLNVKEFFTSEYLVPSADHRQLFDLLNERSEQSVLLVGHEPFLSEAIALLVAGEKSVHLEMKKASCACIDTVRPVEKRPGTLKWLLTVEQMR